MKTMKSYKQWVAEKGGKKKLVEKAVVADENFPNSDLLPPLISYAIKSNWALTGLEDLRNSYARYLKSVRKVEFTKRPKSRRGNKYYGK